MSGAAVKGGSVGAPRNILYFCFSHFDMDGAVKPLPL